MCTAAHEPCTRYVPLGVTLHGSILKALRNLHKGTCLILLNLEQGFSDLNVYKIHEGILFKFRSVVGAVSAFLRSYQVMLVLLVQ